MSDIQDAAARAERAIAKMQACEPNGMVSVPHYCVWSDLLSRSTRDVLALAERAERAASLEARAMYIASEYDCYCETPGVSNDCAVCEVRAALAAGTEGERIVCAACGGKWDDQTTSCEECGGQTATAKGGT